MTKYSLIPVIHLLFVVLFSTHVYAQQPRKIIYKADSLRINRHRHVPVFRINFDGKLVSNHTTRDPLILSNRETIGLLKDKLIAPELELSPGQVKEIERLIKKYDQKEEQFRRKQVLNGNTNETQNLQNILGDICNEIDEFLDGRIARIQTKRWDQIMAQYRVSQVGLMGSLFDPEFCKPLKISPVKAQTITNNVTRWTKKNLIPKVEKQKRNAFEKHFPELFKYSEQLHKERGFPHLYSSPISLQLFLKDHFDKDEMRKLLRESNRPKLLPLSYSRRISIGRNSRLHFMESRWNSDDEKQIEKVRQLETLRSNLWYLITEDAKGQESPFGFNENHLDLIEEIFLNETRKMNEFQDARTHVPEQTKEEVLVWRRQFTQFFIDSAERSNKAYLDLFTPIQKKRLYHQAKILAVQSFGLENAVRFFDVGELEKEQKDKVLTSMGSYLEDLREISSDAEKELNDYVKGQLSSKQNKTLKKMLGKPIGFENHLFEFHCLMTGASKLPPALDNDRELKALKNWKDPRRVTPEMMKK